MENTFGYNKYMLLFTISCTLLSFSACMGPAQQGAIDANTTIVAPGLESNFSITKKTVIVKKAKGGEKTFNVEVADTFEERKLGLMNRPRMEDNAGMLFIFDREEKLDFWMKNTLIPLDIIFIDSNKKIVSIARSAQPCISANCALINSKVPARYVLEVNGGISETLGIKEGDSVYWND